MIKAALAFTRAGFWGKKSLPQDTGHQCPRVPCRLFLLSAVALGSGPSPFPRVSHGARVWPRPPPSPAGQACSHPALRPPSLCVSETPLCSPGPVHTAHLSPTTGCLVGSSGCARCLRTPLARAAQGCQASLPPGGLWPLPKPSLCSCFLPVTYRAVGRPPLGCTSCRRHIPCLPTTQHGTPAPWGVLSLHQEPTAKGLLCTDDKDDAWPRPQRPLDSPWRYKFLLLHRMSPGKLLPLAVVGRMMATKEICMPSPRACDCDA